MYFNFEKSEDDIEFINEELMFNNLTDEDLEKINEENMNYKEDKDMEFNFDDYDFSIKEDADLLDELDNLEEDAEYLEGYEELDELFEEQTEVLTEANIVKMDKATLRKRLLKRAALICSKEAGDPLFTKYAKHAKAKKETRQLIQQKYEGKAKIKLKQYLAIRKRREADKNRAVK